MLQSTAILVRRLKPEMKRSSMICKPNRKPGNVSLYFNMYVVTQQPSRGILIDMFDGKQDCL
jgi:hypothetical protein